MAWRCLLMLVTAAVAAPGVDPFAGSWKLNRSRSRIKGTVVRIEVAKDGLHRFTSGAGLEITCRMDGRDRMTPTGLTMNCRKVNSRTYVTTVRDGKRTRTSATWQLAANGQSMVIVNRVFRADGQARDDRAFVERLSGSRGLAGEWQSTKVAGSVPERIEIRPLAGGGHVIHSPAQRTTLKIRYDGQSYATQGPMVPDGAMTSGKRPDERHIELTETARGKLLGQSTMAVSEDGKTLTHAYDTPYTDGPAVFVYDREAAPARKGKR